MEEIAKIVGTNLLKIIGDAIRAGKDRKEAEKEAARAVERGDIVSDDLYERFDTYIRDVRDFEENG